MSRIVNSLISSSQAVVFSRPALQLPCWVSAKTIALNRGGTQPWFGGSAGLLPFNGLTAGLDGFSFGGEIGFFCFADLFCSDMLIGMIPKTVQSICG